MLISIIIATVTTLRSADILESSADRADVYVFVDIYELF